MKPALIALAAAVLGLMNADAQPHATPKPHFDVTSVKPNKPDAARISNVPMGPDDAWTPNGGLFSASGFALLNYIGFAYKFTTYDYNSAQSRWPSWVFMDRFDIQARALAGTTKDQMRLMMQSLLADRFRLAIHFETREAPVFALVPVNPGKTGPQLQPHSDGSPCLPDNPCGSLYSPDSHPPGQYRIGAQKVTMGYIADILATSEVGRPVVDKTGLAGTFDFTLEWAPNRPANPDFQPDPLGPTYIEAIRDQLGLKLESTKGPLSVPVLDHVERPEEN